MMNDDLSTDAATGGITGSQPAGAGPPAGGDAPGGCGAGQ